MPKKVFWPVAMIAMGLIVLASNLGLLPREFWNLWPLILITAGLGGLLTCDRDEWMVETRSSGSVSKSSGSRRSTAKKRK
jgi:hypothetical protein